MFYCQAGTSDGRRIDPSRERSAWRIARSILLLLLTLNARAGPTSLSAQPFSTLSVSAGAVADLDIGRLADYWGKEPGAFFRIAAPFHVGSVALTAQRTSYPAKNAEQPDFRVLAATVEWNAELALPRGTRAFGGIHAGLAAMRFNDDDDIEGNENESEFQAGVQAGLAVPVAGPAGLILGVAHRRIYTRIPVRTTSVSAGLQVRLRTPDRLRDILE